MKKYFALFLIVAFTACDNAAPKTSGNSDTYTVVTYALDWNKNQFVTSVAQRIVKDTFSFAVVDSSKTEVKQKKQAVSDTSYYIPIQDSARDETGKVRLDSAGNPQFVFHWVPLPKHFLVNDFNKSIR